MAPDTYSDDVTDVDEFDASDVEDATDGHAPGSGHRLEIPRSSSSLENLPSELRDQLLLNVPDLPTLRSLIHASPVMHAQYRSNRNRILCACLGRELDGFFVDAYACLMSRARVLGPIRTDEKITVFLNAYQGWLSGPSPLADLNSVDPGYVRWLAAYHLSVARPLARLYSTWALTNLMQEISSSAGQETAGAAAAAAAAAGDQDAALSKSEGVRIYRALYRYETYYHLFGRNQAKRQGGFRHHEINEIFFCLFNPWEAEAVGCIDLFVQQKYENIFDEVKGDLHPTNPKFRLANGMFNPEGSFDLDGEHDDYMAGTVSRGLKMTVRLLAIDDHGTLVAKMQRCLTHHYSLDAPMRRALGSVAQSDRRELSSNAQDEAERRRDAIEFTGDAVPPNGPPLAWVLLWNRTYANIYGEYVPSTVRQWGYVMWDARRWMELGAEGLVTKQWERVPELVQEIEDDYDWRPSGC
ncbi:hypothetical protein MMYC01_204890 [Madurella mycetomatis]|uniref:Uncharacterized protein n=1 Tax=Madurella mycetomatis TaxID=100816 RepID=A0A175VYZ6_9PEZI|nr:hypothetical protein MMYC01_206000 [Madurella mycetomatis]KXX76869.1 hypothetical protein MMYC01_206733 [Madurella mycetomatis]KXX77740.1 hypothetical protein MMYC01_204890 [Madurella mycetomatis]